MKWIQYFTRWFDRHGGNAHMSDYEVAFKAGWDAAKRVERKSWKRIIGHG